MCRAGGVDVRCGLEKERIERVGKGGCSARVRKGDVGRCVGLQKG